MWVVKYHCGISIPGDTQSSAGPGTAQPHVGGPALPGGLRTHRCPSGLAIFGVWRLLWHVIMRYSHRPPPQKPLQHPLLFSWNATTIRVTAFIYLRDRLASCQRCTQNYCYYIIWGGNEALNSFTWIFLSLQRSSSSSHTHTKNPSTESYREQQNLVLRLTWK